MIIQISIILLLTAFIVLMAYWVVKTENKQDKESNYLEPKTYKKAKEMGLKFPKEYKDALPGV